MKIFLTGAQVSLATVDKSIARARLERPRSCPQARQPRGTGIDQDGRTMCEGRYHRPRVHEAWHDRRRYRNPYRELQITLSEGNIYVANFKFNK